jgi:HAD superfamily 5'-nucleotidase-like hydrolase
MDHTLIRYNGRNFEALAHRIMLEKLVADLNYPPSVLQLKFEYDRAIRGLVIDKIQGNVLKLNRHGAIRISYHGLKAIEYSAQKNLYKSRYIDLGDPEFDTVDTTFSIAFAGLFAQLVELKDTTEATTLPTYDKLAVDLTRVLDRAHRDGSLKNVVAKNLADYIIKDANVVSGLERFKKHGKKIFILTNSDYFYCKMLLDYAINPFLKEHKDWTQVFDFVITLAQKPRFFIDNLPFLQIDPSDGKMSNLNGKITKGIYQGGCASTFTDSLGVAPDEILYIGDHIYGDIVRLKKDCAWRTALVVEELQDEIDNYHQAKPTTDQINTLMSQKLPLEIQLDQVISEKIEKGVDSDTEISKLLQQIGDIDHRISPLIRSQQRLFNPYWGEVMRVGIEESYFAYQVERYACIYMSKLSDLFSMSPRTYFRSFKRPLAHELDI